MVKQRAVVGAITLLVVLTTSSCADNADAPSVASARSDSASPSPVATDGSVEKYLEKRQDFADCLRENGLPDIEDPDELGDVIVDFGDPHLGQALKACKSLDTREPPVEIIEMQQKREAEQMTPQEKQLEIDRARCIQENGVPGYPDPLPNGLPAMPEWAKPDATMPRPAALDRAVRTCNAKLGIGPDTE